MPTLQLHEFSVHHPLTLAYFGGQGGKDLLSEIIRQPASLVDSGIPWKQLARQCIGYNFVLGRTLSEEREDLQGEFFGRKAGGGFPNVFVAGIEQGPCYVVHRLDAHYAACNKGVYPRLSQMAVAEIERFNAAAARLEIRDRVMKDLQRSGDELDAEFIGLLPQSRHNYLVACLTAEKVYARFLLSLGKNEAAKELKKLRGNHQNLFGDTRLIQEALLLGISIVSEDKRDVHRMAAIAGIEVKDAAGISGSGCSTTLNLPSPGG